MSNPFLRSSSIFLIAPDILVLVTDSEHSYAYFTLFLTAFNAELTRIL